MNTKIKILLSIFFLILSYGNSFLQPQTEWIRQFNSGGSNQDYVNDMKLDKWGNIYMCGYIRYDALNSDVLLLKYNSYGVLQWSKTYNGRATFSNDEAKKIIIDDSGYVYLMGKVQFNTITDFLTMKYTPNGDTVWVRSFDGGNDEVDDPTDFALDNNYNIYVTGLIYRKGNNDIGTIKYDRNGNLKWVRVNYYGGPGNMLFDSGYVFINCGLYADSLNRYRINILKYDTTGLLLDTLSFNIGVNLGDKFMIFDNHKNFIVSGEYYADLPTQYDILTLKMNSNGNKSWISGYNNNSDNSSDYLYDLKIDNANYNYILVRSRNVQLRSDIVLIKYENQTGDSIWTRKYQSVPFANDEPSQMSIDKYNNIYITGSSDFNLINNRIVTIKYNFQGILQWHTEYTPSVFVNSEGLRIQNDTLGNLFVSGITNSSSNGDDIVLIKYSNITDIKETDNTIPEKYELYQNYPNPFNSQTEIKFDIAKSDKYKLEIFDILGRRVGLILDENKNVGSYKLSFDASALSSGIYIYKLSSEDLSVVRKFTLIK